MMRTDDFNARFPYCDRCYLGWNDCCPYRISLDQAIVDTIEHTSKEYCPEVFTN